MSDPEKSGAPNEAPADLSAPAPAPAEAAPAPTVAAAPVSPPAAFGSFGANRGSGLVRGKRPASVAAPAHASSGAAGYQPTALEVIKSATEYKNPFTGETSVSAPRANEPAPPAAPTPVAPIAETPAAQPATSPVPESSASLDAAERSSGATPAGQTPHPGTLAEESAPQSTEDAAKAELNILPPENPRRAALHWESNSPSGAAPAEPAQRPDERGTFQTSRGRRDAQAGGQGERRGEGREGGRSFERREPRQPREGGRDPRDAREPRSFEPREPRRDERKTDPRPAPSHHERAPQVEPEKKSGGFVGWLKGIFTGKPDEPSAPQSGSTAGDQRRGQDQRHGGGHRGGGRGRAGSGGYRGENRGPRDQPTQRGEPGQPYQGGENRGEPRGEGDFGGQRRRRRRGGRGRYRGEGGGGDQGPRPEGQQGGGAI